MKRLGEYDPGADEATLRAKRMLQKCAYAMVSHQELSAQQVAAYLVGGGDHYTSHRFRNLYWTSFEASVNDEHPSPECYKAGNVEESRDAEPIEPQCGDEDFRTDEGVENHENNTLAKGDDDETGVDDEEDVHIAFSRTGDVQEQSSQVLNSETFSPVPVAPNRQPPGYQ